MGDLSEHFSRSEFRCRHCGRLVGPDPKLILVLERIRAGGSGPTRPLRIRSGYRCPEHNRRVGGAKASQHLLGKAADIEPGRATLEQARAAGATGIGLSGRWAVHVDVRAQPTTWRY